MNGHIPAGILTLGVLLGISLGEFFSYSPKLQYTMWIQPPMLYITTTLLLSSLLLLPGIFFWRKFEQALENQQAPSVLIEKAHQASTWGWKNPIPWWSTANFLFQKHCFLEASYAYWEGLKCAPWYADAYFKLASIELSHSNPTQALQLCLQGLQLHPHSEKIFPLYRDIL
ncbi:MAG: hypothetical protein QXH91_09545, partial [Candidatus Bathyarchaeia archaeon]